jgi:hypothetical protein
MQRLVGIGRVLALGFEVTLVMLAASRASAQCPHRYDSSGYSSGGWHCPGDSYGTPVAATPPVYERPAPSMTPPKVQVGQAIGETYQSYSATPSTVPASTVPASTAPAATVPTYAAPTNTVPTYTIPTNTVPSYPMYGAYSGYGYYGSPYSYGGFGSSSGRDDDRHHGIP